MRLELIHPSLVHFPIVLIFVVLVLDIVARRRNVMVAPAAAWTAIAAGLFAVVTAGFGAAAEGIATAKGFPETMIDTHASLGIATAIALGLLALVRAWTLWRQVPMDGSRRSVLIVAEALILLLVLVTAYAGGDLVYDHGVNVGEAAPQS